MSASGIRRPAVSVAAKRRAGWLAAVVTLVVLMPIATLSAPAGTAGCNGAPDAIGTSRTIVVDPAEHPRIGTMQYAETLPLRDREVVLTFDDGPLPRHSADVLAILASQCVKATFFIVGRMAHQFPQDLRRIHEAGHTIGAHSENHPLTFHRMPLDKAIEEIDRGIAHIAEALGDASAVAPFFRIPGLLRADAVEQQLAARRIMTWSADFPADDWRPVSAAQVARLAISRLEAKGKGVLLLHDIQPRTVAALPLILRELRARGYRIVHVVPARPDLPKTPTEPADWRMLPAATETVVAAKWPPVPRFVFGATQATPALAVTEAALFHDVSPRLSPLRRRQPAPGRTARQPAVLWPHPAALTQTSAAADLPAPDGRLFRQADDPQPDPRQDLRRRNHAMLLAPEITLPAQAGHLDLAAHIIPGSHPIPPPALTP